MAPHGWHKIGDRSNLVYLSRGKRPFFRVIFFILPLITIIGSASVEAQQVNIFDGDFELDVRGEFTGTISDNVNLTRDNKQYGYALTFSPGINMRYKTGRTQVSVDYFADYFYFLHDNSTDIRHNLFATLDSEVIENNLTLFGRAGIQQEFIDRTGSFSQNDATKSDNRRAVSNFTARSQWRNRIYNFAKFRLNYELGVVKSPADNVDDDTLTVNFSDTVSHNLGFVLASGPQFSRVTWEVSGNKSKVTKSLVDEPFREDNVQAKVSYEVDPTLKVSAGYGKRSNNAQTTKLKLDDYYKIYGINWRPGPKLTVDLNREQYPNRNYDSVNVKYQVTTRVSMTVTHGVDFTSNGLDLAQSLDQLNYEQKFGINDGTGVPVDNSDLAFSLSDVDFEKYNWQIGLRWLRRRDEFFIAYDRERRVFDNGLPDSSSWGYQGGWKHKLSRGEIFTANGSFRENLINEGERIDRYYTFSTNYQNTLSRYFNLNIEFAHTKRVSSDPTGNLKENAFIIYLRGTY